MTEYIAIDIGKKNCVTCAMDQDGTVSERSSYPNTSFDAGAFARNAIKRYGACKAAVESTGNMWLKTYEAFESNGIEIKLANPLKTRAIAEAKIKTDSVDSTTLANLLRGDLIAECFVPPKAVRQSRALLSHQANLVRERTRIKNRIHSLLDKFDIEFEYNNMFGARGLKILHDVLLNDEHDKEILESLLRQVEFLTSEETITNSSIASDALADSYVRIIMSMPGFDYYGASLLSAYIADISRFRSPSQLVSWAGMCPSIHQSGESLHLGKMKKDGNRKVNWIMIQTANAAVRSNSRMKGFYERKLRRHNHSVAITHVANKMLKIIWHMLTENRLYNERNETYYQTKLKKMARIAQ